MAEPETFTWVPNWVNQVTESLKDQREEETIGRSRGITLEGEDDSIRFYQTFTLSLDATEATSFLDFWNARKGPWQAFKGPSIWQPGSAAQAAPHSFTDTSTTGLLRFADDELTINWLDPSHCDIQIGLIQTIDGTEGDPFVYLYDIYCEDADYGYATEHLTEWSASVTVGETVYLPARIENEEVNENVEFQKETVKINVDIRDSELILAKIQRKLDANISVVITQVNSTTGDSWEIFAGRIGTIERKGRKATCEIQLWSGIASLQFPTCPKSRTCPFTLFDGGCSRVLGSSMSKNNWRSFATYIETWGDGKLQLDTASIDSKCLAYEASHPNPDQATDGQINWGYWANGFAITGIGKKRQIRPLTFSSHAVNGIIGIIPMWPFRETTGWLTVGDVVSFYPGCDGTQTTCSEKFDNLDSFGGQPFTPAHIEEAGSSTQSSGK